jgi:Fic family protein
VARRRLSPANLPHWDDDSPALRANLTHLAARIQQDAQQRTQPTLQQVRQWHGTLMQGLNVPSPAYVGRFRGEDGVKVNVYIGSAAGVPHAQVADELRRFEQRLQRAVEALDQRYPSGEALDEDGLAAVIDLAGWAHAEWVRIHPFANGNGRTARLWANSLLVRYGLPPVLRLRPRPGGTYGAAGARAMEGDWGPTARHLRRLLAELDPG